MATAATVAQQLSTARAALQQANLDYTTVTWSQPERQRLNDDLVTLRIVLNSLVNTVSGGGR